MTMIRLSTLALFGALMLPGCANSPFTPQVVLPVAQATVTATGLQKAVSTACGFVGDITSLGALITANPLVGTIGGFVQMVCDGLTKSGARRSGAPAVSIANGIVIRGHWK